MTHTTQETPAGFDVLVEHHTHQSYGRAVIPFAQRVASHLAHTFAKGKAVKVLRFERLDDDATFQSPDPTRCRSRLVFTMVTA